MHLQGGPGSHTSEHTWTVSTPYSPPLPRLPPTTTSPESGAIQVPWLVKAPTVDPWLQ